LRPLKFRVAGEFRDVPLPENVSEAIDKHVAEHGTTPDGYLFQGRKYKLVVRRSYQEDFQRSAVRAGLPPEFIPHSLRHFYASTALAEGIPITEVSRWLDRSSGRWAATAPVGRSCRSRLLAYSDLDWPVGDRGCLPHQGTQL
jgi:integrase